MDRRNFFKILSATSAGVLSSDCGHKPEKLIPLLVPEHEIVPGEEQWHAAVCAECPAACGSIVRIMEAVRTVERQGEQVRERIAAVKKIEGNPLDPISGGRLCARGQAAVQALYHPDRLHGAMRRTGSRGQAAFAPISWDEAIGAAAEAIAKVRAVDPSGILFLTGPHVGTRSLAIERFLQALGAPPPVICSLADFSVELQAAELVFGWAGLPVYDLAQAHFVLSVGADFLGSWASPVYYARQFGQFRQGRGEVRGRLVHAESRLSTTAAAADDWLPLRPGSEPQFLGAAGRILLDSNLAPRRDQLPAVVRDAFQSADTAALLASCGLEEKRIRPLVQRLGQSAAPLVIAGASVVHSNSLDAVVASHYINLMLGSVSKPGGMLPPATAAAARNHRVSESLPHARAVLIAGANPAYMLPRSSGILGVLSRADTVISFGSFLDDSAARSDLLLPDHHPLESAIALVPPVAPQPVVTAAAPFVRPLYDTRAVEQALASVAAKMSLAVPLVTPKDVLGPLLPGEISYDDALREGGLRLPPQSAPPPRARGMRLEFRAPEFAGDSSAYPLHFQPYLSQQFHDGSGSHLPWMQELPDPASSAIWGLPVEIDPRTAAALRVANGDLVRVESAYGSIEAPVYVHPGAAPGVVSMAIGDGHTHYSRYASGRGASPISILAPVFEKSTGAPALGATRVRLARSGAAHGWIQFSRQDRENRGVGYR